jgi:hypothetical protein
MKWNIGTNSSTISGKSAWAAFCEEPSKKVKESSKHLKYL